MIRILHTADLHLGAAFPELGEADGKRQYDFSQTFERLLTLAIKNEVHLFIVAGNLFHSPWPSLELVDRVRNGIKRLSDRGILTVLLPGVNDHVLSADSAYLRYEFPGAILLAAPLIEAPVAVQVADREVFLYGFAYHSFPSALALSGMPRCAAEGIHIGVLHDSRPEGRGRDELHGDAPLSPEQLREWNLDYLALGGRGNFELLESPGRIYGCYPGSPEGRRFGENGTRSAVLAQVDNEGAMVEPLPTGGRILDEMTLDLSACETLTAMFDKIRALGKPELLLRLTLTGVVEVPLDLAKLHARAAGQFFYLELIDQTRMLDSALAQRLAAEEMIRGVLVRRARRLREECPAEQRQLVEDAFRETLLRLRISGGGRS